MQLLLSWLLSGVRFSPHATLLFIRNLLGYFPHYIYVYIERQTHANVGVPCQIYLTCSTLVYINERQVCVLALYKENICPWPYQ